MTPWTTTPEGGAATLNTAASAELKLALVVPTLNEEENIGPLLDRARVALDAAGVPFEILVVDDDSRDRTGAVVAALAKDDPRIRLIVRRGERGLSGAILDGWKATNAGILGVIDADLQHPPELLTELYRAVAEGRDVAIGSRYTPGGGIGDWNIVRKLLSSAAIWATWPLQKRGARANDPMSGFFLVRRGCVEDIAFQRAGFKLLLEILIRGRLVTIKEIPFSFGLRVGGESKAGFKVGWDYARLLAGLYGRKLGLSRRHTATGETIEN